MGLECAPDGGQSAGWESTGMCAGSSRKKAAHRKCYTGLLREILDIFTILDPHLRTLRQKPWPINYW
jgi:hypothetical protein